ncbi:MAG TPA: ATP-binding cassette domain-containing protein [Bryobacteraceae bacterium]|nr:ATP-binding cassette domain-containing protein [Bryobacteraceae bacterium]
MSDLAYLSFRDVSYGVAGRAILERLTLGVELGETLVLLGRSGSGKTTALRLINRLLEPTAGTIYLNGRDTRTVNAIELRRGIGYVIQEFGLLPHWTVEQNVALVPRLLGWPEAKQKQKAGELLAQVGLSEEMGARHPHELSGGQRQRVAVARALAAGARLLLFDEPFGALDPVTRHEMQQQFLELRRRYEVASVFVTHDLMEALTIGTKIAVLDRGKLEALVTPDEFFGVQTPTARAFLETLPKEMRGGYIK